MPIDLGRLLSGQALVGSTRESPLPVAVLTMELQRGIMGDLASLPDLGAAAEAAGVVANTARLLGAARRLTVPVVHCMVEHRADRAGTVLNTPLHSALLRTSPHMLVGTPETELVPELGPAAGDLVSTRVHGVSPFTGTSLDATLRNLGVKVVIATGVSVNVALMGLCIEAVNLGYQVVVPTDAVAGVPADYAAAVVSHSMAMVAALTTVDRLIAVLDELTA